MHEKSLRYKQLMVLAGGAGGLIINTGFICALYYGVHFTLPESSSPIDAVLYTLKWNIFPALSLLMGIGAVANSRFLSENINPLHSDIPPRLHVYIRYVDNTHQQCFLFLVMSLVLSMHLGYEYLNWIPILCLTFVMNRFLFWLGYHIHPVFRAPGMFGNEVICYIPLLYLGYRVLIG